MNTNISTSPERHSFSRNRVSKDTDNDPASELADMSCWYDSFFEIEATQINDPAWQKNNMEYDLRTADWILKKASESDTYAQNLYAALCNNSFRQLKSPNEEQWSCSWRYAGGIIAHMQEKGDYIDWYCSGIGGIMQGPDGSVDEGIVTDEICEDLQKLGWEAIPE